jgi:hypothetical protein
MFASSIKNSPAFDLTSLFSTASSSFQGGRLPPVPGQHPYGYISGDQRLHLGAAQLSTGKIVEDLKQLGFLCKSARQLFGSPKKFDEVLSSVNALELGDSAPIPQSLDALRKVLDGADIDSRVYRNTQRIGATAPGKKLSEGELGELRDVLLEGALISTALCAFENATVVEPINPIKSLWNSLWGAHKRTHPVVREYVRTLPFDKYAPHYLRYNLDTSAQRIRLDNDGSPEISARCEAEHRANQLLSAGALSRKASISAGYVSISMNVISKEDGRLFLAGDVTIPGVFHVLTLAQRSVDLIQRLLTVEKVDLVRLCALAHRGAGMDMSIRLAKVSPVAHVRLSDVLEWSPIFESREKVVLSEEKRADLASLLLDAEAVLDVMDSLKDALGQPWSERWWRSQWTKGINDKEIRVALKLLDAPPVFRDLDYMEPSELAMKGAFALGYSQEDREGKGFGTPENPVQSLAWLLAQEAPMKYLDTPPVS